jgi:signal transduction histidine kinase/ligand-binding sensor domain-containing protein
LIIANTFWAATASAQATRHDVFGRYQQFTWTERDGMPRNAVLALATTRDGYLWLGTYEGLARFDGVRFTLFNPSTTTGIGNAHVSALLVGRDGDLWIATFGGGVSRRSGGRFTQYGIRDGLANNFTICLFEDRRGTLWIGTDGGGVSAFRDGHFTTYTVAQGLPSNFVRRIVDDGHGEPLIGTSLGLVRLVDGHFRAVETPAGVVGEDISALTAIPDGAIAMALRVKGGFSRLDLSESGLAGKAGLTVFDAAHGFTKDRVTTLLADSSGVLWIGTVEEGLYRYAAGRFDHYTMADGLPGVHVLSMAPGIDHDLWIGTESGLVQFKTPRIRVYTDRDGLTGEQAANIFQDRDGSVWAEAGSRVARFVHGAFTRPDRRDGMPDGRVGLIRSATSFPLIYNNAGMMRWASDRFVPVPDVAGLPWDRVAAGLEDRSGALWLSVHDDGLIRVRNGQVTHLTKKDGLADDAVSALFEDRAGNLWVGTFTNGMTRIAGGTMTSWSMRDGLPSNFVKAFHQDTDGTMWVGTHGGGLSRFKDGRFANISVRQGLYNDVMFQILDDDQGNFWMNCNTGIWRTSVQELNDVADGRRRTVESFAYGIADGMLSSEGVGANIAGWKMRDGTLWFPTTKGIVVIDPRRRDTDPPRVVIEGTVIDRVPVPTAGPVRLTPDQENLEIQYTGLNWSRPPAMRFRYRLDGLDREWVDPGSRRTAYYSHLPPGSYTFTVIADNGEGVWNTTGQSLDIVVLPRLYQTMWFRVAVVSSLVALVLLAWRYRSAQMMRAQAAQQAFSRQLIESEERERQRIAAELHDSLGQSLLVVKNRALLGALAQQDGEARKQFDEIGATVTQTLEEVRTIAYNLRPHHLEQLGLTTTIHAMIEKSAESSGIHMTSDLDDIDGLFPPDQEIIIYRIIQESVNNVIKHAQAREAHVTVRCEEHQVEITIRDDGQGFAPAASTNGAAPGRGFGLKGLAERAHMLGGTHTIESAPGRGTTVTVAIGVGGRPGAAAWPATSAS